MSVRPGAEPPRPGTDERALKIALIALHEQRQRGLAGTVTRDEWAQAILVLEGLLAIAKQFGQVAG